jgi:hypothetical protein
MAPTPTRAILDAIRSILARHNTIEEGPEGVYGQFERLPGIDAEGILTRLQTAPTVALNPHVDNATVVESVRASLHRAGYSLVI